MLESSELNFGLAATRASNRSAFSNQQRDTWGGGGRSLWGMPFAHLGTMTKLPGNLRRGGTTFLASRQVDGTDLGFDADSVHPARNPTPT